MSNTPIYKLTFDSMFLILKKYDEDRNRSGENYLQPDRSEDEIELLLGLLAHKTEDLIKDRLVDEDLLDDLKELSNTISTSQYLAQDPEMEQLKKLVEEIISRSNTPRETPFSMSGN